MFSSHFFVQTMKGSSMSKAWQSVCVMLAITAASSAAWAEAEGTTGFEKLSLRPVLYADSTPASMDQVVDRIKNPFAGFTWGADERMRNEYFDNAITLNEHAKGHEFEFWRYRSRIWASYSPSDYLELNARLAWEGRHYWQPSSKPEWDDGYGFVDTLNFKLKNKEAGLTLTVGRQDIILGDGWLVLEGTPLDGSTSIYFDAARLTWNAKAINTTFDLIAIDNYASQDVWMPTISDVDRPQIEQDERGAILYISNKSIKDTTIEPYFIYKHDQKRAVNGDNGDIYTFGTRIEHTVDEHWKGRIEGAGQFGEKNNQSLAAWGLLGRLTYSFKDPMDNQLKFNFEALSGDNPSTKTNEAFDPLWGRWPQWSELYVYAYLTETRIAQTTNLYRVGPAWQATPIKDLVLSCDYNLLFAQEKPLAGTGGFGTGNFRGQIIQAVAKYKFNRYLSGHLWGEYFLPGDYYSSTKGDNAVYLRAELVLTF